MPECDIKKFSSCEIDPNVPMISRNDLFIEKLLGRGYYASVFLVSSSENSSKDKFAMKISKQCQKQQFELNVLHSLNHENVLKMFSACYIENKLACITEFAAGGSLSDLLNHIQTNSSNESLNKNSDDAITNDNFPWKIRVKIALDIIRGLNYLHMKNLIHRDLSSQNILLRMKQTNGHHNSTENDTNNNSNKTNKSSSMSNVKNITTNRLSELNYELIDDEIAFLSSSPDDVNNWSRVQFEKYSPHYNLKSLESCQAIVADMGLVLDMNKSDSSPLEINGNPYYTAPEILHQNCPYKYDLSSDIFAFGLLCCELILCLVNDGTQVPRINNFGLDAENMNVPETCPEDFFALAKECCSITPSCRPLGHEIEQRLQNILSTL